jgi:hypothetical protein
MDLPGLPLFMEQPAGQDQYTIRLPTEVHTVLEKRAAWWLPAHDLLASKGPQGPED